MTKLKTIGGAAIAIIGLVASIFGIIQFVQSMRHDPSAEISDAVARKLDERLNALLDARLGALGIKSAQAHESEAGLRRDLQGAVKSLQGAGAEGRAAVARLLQDGKTEEARKLLARLAKKDEAAGAAANKHAAERYRQLGALAFLNDTKAAMRAYAKAVELAPDNPDGWNQLGRLQARTGALDAAAQSFEKVLALGKKLGDKSVEASVTGNLGLIYQARGELDRAEKMQLKSLELEKELGRKAGMAASYGNLGVIYEQRGELERAEKMQLKSLEIETELGRKEGMAASYGNLGIIYMARGEIDRAEKMYLNSLQLYEELGSKEGMAATYGNLGIISEQRGTPDRSEKMYKRQLDLAIELGIKEQQASATANLGGLYEHKGDIARACAHWGKARDLYREIGVAAEIKKKEGWMRKANCPGI